MTNEQIKTVGQTIAQETTIGGNTAARVGGVVEGIGVALDNKDAAIGYFLGTISGGSIYVNAPNYLLGSGGNLKIKMPAAATSACTLTIGNAQAVQLWYNGAAVSSSNTWDAGEIVSVYYDGTRFMASNSQGGAKFSGGQKVSDITLEQTLGSGVNTVVSQKGVSDAVFNEIDINDIDDLKNLADALNPSSSLKPTYYTVTAVRGSVVMKVGSMAVISDNMGHVVTEIMSTHYLLDTDGYLTDEHNDAEVFTIFRSVKGNGGTLPTPVGTWTAWKYINQSVWPDVASVEQRLLAMMGYYVCDTAAGTADKTISASGYILTNGGCIRIKMTNANTADNATLNINSTGAKALFYDGAQASSANTWEAGEVLEVYYDGTQYQCASGGGGKFATGQKVKETSISNNIANNTDAIPTCGAVDNALNDILGSTTVIDLSQYTQQNCSLGSNVWYLKNTGKLQRHIAIPVTAGDKYVLQAVSSESSEAYYAFVKSSYSPPYVSNDPIPFVPSETSRNVLNIGSSISLIVPEQSAYLILTTVDGADHTTTWSLSRVDILAFATGEKLKQTSITNIITQGSDALITSGAVAALAEGILIEGTASPTWFQGSIGSDHTYSNSGTAAPNRIVSTLPSAISFTVEVANGYWCSIHEYSAEFANAPAIVDGSSWLGNTHTWFDGILNFTPLAATKTVVLIMSKGDKSQPVSPSDGSNISVDYVSTVKNDVIRNTGDIEDINTELNGYDNPSGQYTPVWYQGSIGSNHAYSNIGTAAPYRIVSALPANSFTVTVASGYWCSIHEYSAEFANAAAINDGSSWLGNTHPWFDGTLEFTPVSSSKTVVFIMSKGDKSQAVIPSDGSNISVYATGGHTKGLIERVDDLEKSYQHEYYGQRLQRNTFDVVDFMAYPAVATPTQGMAIYNIYCVQGTSTESNGKTKAELLDLQTGTKIADLILSHDGYSAIHCNVMCFGSETATGGIMPLLYASQWDGEGCCFVYNILTSGATLMQVIDPSQITKDNVKFGIGNIDWVVDYDHNYIYALSYTGSGYSGGQIITRFALPALSAGTTVMLTDNDILGYNHLGEYIIRQDACYRNNSIYLLFGSTGQYTDQLAIHVVDANNLIEVTTLPLQFLTIEPEGLDFYKGNMLLHLINESKLLRIVY